MNITLFCSNYNFYETYLQLLQIIHRFFFFNFQSRMLRGGGAKKYNIDYFGYAVNSEFKFKLNFDVIRSNKEKKVKIQKKIEY